MHSVWGQFWVIQAHGLHYVTQRHQWRENPTKVLIYLLQLLYDIMQPVLAVGTSNAYVLPCIFGLTCRIVAGGRTFHHTIYTKHWTWGRMWVEWRSWRDSIQGEALSGNCMHAYQCVYICNTRLQALTGNQTRKCLYAHKCFRWFPTCVKPPNDAHTGQDFGHTERDQECGMTLVTQTLLTCDTTKKWCTSKECAI